MNKKEQDTLNNYRLLGLEMAHRLVKTGGIEALEKEIRIRKAGYRSPVSHREIDEAAKGIKEMCNDTYKVMSVWTLRNAPFNFGKTRLQRFIDQFDYQTSFLAGGYMTFKDITDQILEELDMELRIRYNG